jgi:hypothetical protein
MGAVLPQVFQHQAREDLRERTRLLAEAAAQTLTASRTAPREPELDLRRIADHFTSSPDFLGVAAFDGDGRIIHQWPAAGPPWPAAVTPDGPLQEMRNQTVSFTRLAEPIGPIAMIGVRTSTTRLQTDLLNLNWLFVSIFLFAGAIFMALAVYLTRAVVHPLEELRLAARRMADGEAGVRLPVSGDRELDELAGVISTLAGPDRPAGSPVRPGRPDRATPLERGPGPTGPPKPLENDGER